MQSHPVRRTRAVTGRWRGPVAVVVGLGLLALPPAGSGPAGAATDPACAAAPLDREFDDVRADGTFADAIACVAGYGLVDGYPDDTYRPGDPVTRAEAASLVLDALETATGAQLDDPGTNPFRDVAYTGVHGPAILRLERAGIVSGTSSTRYGGDRELTRGQMAAVVVRGFEHVGVAFDDTDVDYDDVPDAGTFDEPISKLTNAEVVEGLGDGLFGPGQPVTRAQLARFVATSLEVAHRQGLWLPTVADPQWTPLRGSAEHLRVSLPGPRVANLVRWQLDDPAVRLRTDFAGGITWRDKVVAAARRKDALVAVNAGFWVHGNDPDGLLVRDRQLDSDTSVTTNGSRNIRSGFALHGRGTPVVGVPNWYGSLTMGRFDGSKVSVRIDGVNRVPFPDDEVVAYSPGDRVGQTTRPGRYYVYDTAPDLNRSGTHALQVVDRHDGDGPVRAGRDQLVVWIDDDVPLREVPDDDTPTLRVQYDPAWEGSRVGLVAGPWLLRDGDITSEAQWRGEGFTGAHTDVRHPRSAIGFTADGYGVIATVDGRRPGASIGSTHTQVAQLMRRWGVVDAIMLDGGGSTQLAIRGQYANRPCCDKVTRTVSTVLLLQPS